MLIFKTIKEKIKHANFHWVNLIAFKLMKPTKRHNKSIVSLETIDLFFSCSLNVFFDTNNQRNRWDYGATPCDTSTSA